MELWRLHSLMFLFFVGATMTQASFATPEDALKSLEQAYIEKNADAAVAAKDFAEEARYMMLKNNPSLATDSALLAKLAEVLELAFRKELNTSGFPDFASLQCTIISKEHISDTLVRLVEVCTWPDGGKSTEIVHTALRDKKWRVVILPSKAG